MSKENIYFNPVQYANVVDSIFRPYGRIQYASTVIKLLKKSFRKISDAKRMSPRLSIGNTEK